ncbi:MAG TPA: hypothetical protein VFO03_07065 [Gaiellaceae bacterium]|nr:hypothetical protein [Gaiellaceae bacterium]
MRRQGIPLFDVRNLVEPMRRTAVVRLTLAAALVATLLAAAWLSRDTGASAVRVAEGGKSGVVVLDMSASIGSARKRLTEPFEYLAATNQDFGLVLFSSVAYEAMPPGTPGTELRGFLRAIAPFNVCIAREFTPCPPGQRRVDPDSPEFERIRRQSTTPWSEEFRGGTKISTGLELARRMLARNGQEKRGTLLISDLDDSLLDIPSLTRELITYKREGIPLHLVAMAPFDDDRFFFERMVGKDAFVDRANLAPPRLADERRRAEHAGVPAGLAGLALVLLMLLAANEHFCGRLAWRPERTTAGDA